MIEYIADKELRKEADGEHLLNKYAKHTSSVVVIWRNKGGSDDDPQLQAQSNKGYS